LASLSTSSLSSIFLPYSFYLTFFSNSNSFPLFPSSYSSLAISASAIAFFSSKSAIYSA
jgi:hypothetical protein